MPHPIAKTALRLTAGLLITVTLAVGSYWYYLDRVLPEKWNHKNTAELREINKTKSGSAAKFAAFIKDVEAARSWKIYITSGLLSPEEQANLKLQNTQNAAAYRSKHVLGLAIDINLFQRHWFGYRQLMKASERKRWEASGILAIVNKHGLKWGGSFKSYYDPVHFEITK